MFDDQVSPLSSAIAEYLAAVIEGSIDGHSNSGDQVSAGDERLQVPIKRLETLSKRGQQRDSRIVRAVIMKIDELFAQL